MKILREGKKVSRTVLDPEEFSGGTNFNIIYTAIVIDNSLSGGMPL